MRCFFVIVFAFFLGINISYSTHLLGGYVSAEKISGNTYEFTVYLFHDDGSPVTGGSGQMDFGDGTIIDGEKAPFRLTMRRLSSGMRLGFFKVRHTFSAPGKYTVSYSEGNRNYDAVNIKNSVINRLFIFVDLYLDPIVSNESTPTVNNYPSFDIKSGIPFYHNLELADKEGDIVKVTYGVPRKSKNEYVDFYRPVDSRAFYSKYLNHDGTGEPVFKINPVSGSFYWDAPGDASGNHCHSDASSVCAYYTISIKVEEFSRLDPNIKLSETVIDMTFYVTDNKESANFALSEPECLTIADPFWIYSMDSAGFFLSTEMLNGIETINQEMASLFYDSVLYNDTIEIKFNSNFTEDFKFQKISLLSAVDSSQILNYHITVTDGDDCESEFITQEAGRFLDVLSTGEVSEDIKIYPNPASGFLNIVISETFRGTYRFSIIGLDGKTVFDPLILHKDERITLPSDMKSGIYIVHIADMNTGELYIQKLRIRR